MTGAGMDRRRDSSRLSLFAQGATAMATPDARWALVSSSLTLLVAGSIAWLAMGTLPPAKPYGQSASHVLLPYQLFLKLTQGAADHARVLTDNTPAPDTDDNANPAP